MLALVAAGCSITVVAAAQATGFHGVNPVPGKALGTAVPLMPGGGLKAVVLAQGSTRLDGATSANPYYGYDGDGPMVPAPGDVPSDGHLVEATKTDPHGSPRSDRARRAGADFSIPSPGGYRLATPAGPNPGQTGFMQKHLDLQELEALEAAIRDRGRFAVRALRWLAGASASRDSATLEMLLAFGERDRSDHRRIDAAVSVLVAGHVQPCERLRLLGVVRAHAIIARGLAVTFRGAELTPQSSGRLSPRVELDACTMLSETFAVALGNAFESPFALWDMPMLEEFVELMENEVSAGELQLDSWKWLCLVS